MTLVSFLFEPRVFGVGLLAITKSRFFLFEQYLLVVETLRMTLLGTPLDNLLETHFLIRRR